MLIHFFSKAEVTGELLEEQVKHAQQEKMRGNLADILCALSLSNIHHILPSLLFPSLPCFIAASIVINTLVDKRKSNRLPQGACEASISMLFVLGKNQLKMYSCHRFIIHTHIFFNLSMSRHMYLSGG